MSVELVRKIDSVAGPLHYLKDPERLWILGYLLGLTGADAYDERFALGLKAGRATTDMWDEFTLKNPDGYSTSNRFDEDEDEDEDY